MASYRLLLCRSPLHSPVSYSTEASSDGDSSIQSTEPTFPKNYRLLAETIDSVCKEMVRKGENLRRVSKAKLKLSVILQREALCSTGDHRIRHALNIGRKASIINIVRFRLLYLLDPPKPDTTMTDAE